MLRLAAHHEIHRESADEAVLEGERFLEEHGARGAAVAVDQREPAVRLARQDVRRQRQDRGDAAARGERDVGLRARADPPPCETARPGCPRRGVSPARSRRASSPRHAPAGLLAHTEPQHRAARRGDDGIGAPLLDAVDRAPHGDVLSGVMLELIAQFGRNRQREADGVLGGAIHGRDFERMKQHACQMHLKHSNGSRQSRQRCSALQGVEPNSTGALGVGSSGIAGRRPVRNSSAIRRKRRAAAARCRKRRACGAPRR